MNFYIPELKYTFYGPIVFISIIIGMLVACFLMKKSGVKKEAVFYTALLTFVSILVCSASLSVALSGDIRKIGFVGAGGALGLIIGAITSALINNDHISESISAWIISAPLMYGLSKTACHIAGCCKGIPYSKSFRVTYQLYDNKSFFPIQLTETFVFLIIFFVGLFLYFKIKNKMNVAAFILLLSGLSKIALEFLRESHIGKFISSYQIIVLSITLIGVITILLLSHFSTRKKANDS